MRLGRALTALAAILATPLEAASLRFVTPLQGSQVVGAQAIEVTTDAAAVDRVEFRVDGVLIGVARTPPFRVVCDFGADVGLHRIEAKAFSNGYHDVDVAAITTAAFAESIDVDLVEVPLRVRCDRALIAADLRVRENGVAQTIRLLAPSRGAAHFVFVVDRSLSMGEGKLTETLAAVDEERRLLRPDDRVSVILFNHTLTPPRAIARDEKVALLFDNVEPSGGTALRDALALVPDDDRAYVIVITDGSDRNSELSEEEALRRISGRRTTVDAIVLSSRSTFLNHAARNTGGEVVRASRGEVDSRLRTLIEDINSRYLLVYQSSGTPRGWRTIEVRTTTSGIRILGARKGYFAR
jgi:hypothetical protein